MSHIKYYYTINRINIMHISGVPLLKHDSASRKEIQNIHSNMATAYMCEVTGAGEVIPVFRTVYCS